MSLEVIILAAGQGTRMRSKLPKVLHPLAGKPMLRHVVETAQALHADAIHVVIGHGAESVQAAFGDTDVNWVLQSEQLGTGHAVAQAMPAVADESNVLVLYGDVPMVDAKTVARLLGLLCSDCYGLLTVRLDDPTGYGRIIRNASGEVQRIVEQKDASDAELSVNEINTGIVAGHAADFKRWLPQLDNSNAQGEYYLTDLTAMAVADGYRIVTTEPATAVEVEGVNSRAQLEQLERVWQRRYAAQLMADGASLADADRIDVRGELRTGQDVHIDVNCVFEGTVSLADDVVVGANCVLRNVEVGAGTVIEPHSILDDAKIGKDCKIGPFARIRPGTVMDEGAKVGNFVETKKALIGRGSKVNHLTYIGDAELGSDVNVGAGTITCNYDGVNKFKTVIGDGVFIGSNSSLVAPVTIEENATVGAGSVITGDVAANQLAVARGKQRNIDGWKRPTRK